jgi:hypothetical protein
MSEVGRLASPETGIQAAQPKAGGGAKPKTCRYVEPRIDKDGQLFVAPTALWLVKFDVGSWKLKTEVLACFRKMQQGCPSGPDRPRSVGSMPGRPALLRCLFCNRRNSFVLCKMKILNRTRSL